MPLLDIYIYIYIYIYIEPEEEVDTDEKGPYILQSEVEKAVKEIRNRKATGDDDVPGDVLKLLKF